MTSKQPYPDDPERHLPADHNPLPSLDGAPAPAMNPDDFHRVRASEDFTTLRSTFRGFAFPMTVAFLVWYFLYVILSTFAKSFMAATVPGMSFLNVGLLMGLAQFVTTFAITWLYIRHANAKLDPIASKLRNELEGKVQ